MDITAPLKAFGRWYWDGFKMLAMLTFWVVAVLLFVAVIGWVYKTVGLPIFVAIVFAVILLRL